MEEADDVTILEISDSNQEKSRKELLSSEVCEFFGEYQETDADLKKACMAQNEQLAETGEKILSTLKSLDKDYKACEEKDSCKSKMNLSQMDNIIKIRGFISKFNSENVNINKTSNFHKEIS